MTNKHSNKLPNKLYGVVGNPISHSKSPRIHSLFAAQTGEPVEYVAIQAPLDGFAATVTEFFEQGGGGLNVTVPFKEQAWTLADTHTQRCAHAGAANTLYRDEDDQLVADNTDGVGLVTDLTVNHGVELTGKRLLILGAGGAVRGVLGPILACKPAAVVIANRTLAKAEALVSLYQPQAVDCELSACGFEAAHGHFDVVINGTSASLQDDLPPVPPELINVDTVVYDMMYSASATTFNQWALDQGARNVYDGLGMLVEQAAEAFYVWRGVRPVTTDVVKSLRPG